MKTSASSLSGCAGNEDEFNNKLCVEIYFDPDTEIKDFGNLKPFFAEKYKDVDFHIPKEIRKSLARCFLPDIIAFYESDEGKSEYEQWKKGQVSG